MPLSWNEIRQRAITFAREWSTAGRERAEAQTFWNEFFNVFGKSRKTVATFEEPVKNLKGRYEFIDLFWKGRLLAEHKSRGQSLAKAESQAFDYVQNLINEGRQEEVPRYVLVSDFARLALHDLEPDDPARKVIDFDLAEFPQHIRDFAFIAGYETRILDPEDPANVKAVEILGNLHDRLEEGGYTGHDLQRFMVRILFCLFAEDTGIFEPDAFRSFILNRTAADGSDLGGQLSRLFDTLNTPEDKRQTNLDDDLAALPYVNGQLFAERLAFPDFNQAMRTALLACCNFKWEKISPAVFGSLFQAVMEDKARRQIGAHYTSERDILKLIRSLFLDDLRAEFESIRRDPRKLGDFHRRLGKLRFLDPACGCGNFLVISYRELRRLEMDVLQARFGYSIGEGDIRANCQLAVNQFYGIEIEEWPVRIAEVALWLMDHQLNAELFQRFGSTKATVPLKSSPTIRQGNALRMDWNEVLPAGECAYVLGNPPFVGAKFQNDAQRADMDHVAGRVRSSGLLDYVTGWYFKASEYVRGRETRCAFVSTNSITQGEQVGILWGELFRRGAKIHFGHRTFVWQSEARGKAHVHVVIIGWGMGEGGTRRIYDYGAGADPEHGHESVVSNISPYLVEGPDRAVENRTKPICDAPAICFGNQPIDGGHLLLSQDEHDELLRIEPSAREWIRPYVGAEEFINGQARYCLWLKDASGEALRDMPKVMERVTAVRNFRLDSKRPVTRALAKKPAAFAFISHPEKRYLLIPSVSSERRDYIPMGFMPPRTIASNLCLIVPGATLYHFGVLSSAMHMAWVRQVCGRMKSDYRYSNKLVYNNFPWPAEVKDKQRAKIESLAQRILDLRVECGDGRHGYLPNRGSRCTLADLYDPLVTPSKLVKAHTELDRAVDRCYRPQPFDTERQRVEYLFGLYASLIAPLTGQAAGKKTRARRHN